MKSMNKLVQNDPIIDWEPLRPTVKDLYRNNTDKGGRPNIDEIVGRVDFWHYPEAPRRTGLAVFPHPAHRLLS